MENCDPVKKEVKSAKKNLLDDLFKSPALRFPGRRRKRQKVEPDNVSLASMDSLCSVDSVASCDSVKSDSRRKKAMNRMSSIASLLSPVKPVKKVGHALQRSLSLRSLGPLPPHHRSNNTVDLDATSEDTLGYVPSAPSSQMDTPSKSIASYREPLPTPPKRRVSVLWSDTIISKHSSQLTPKQLKCQEAIFELYKSEQDLVDDMIMVKTTYYNSMLSLKIIPKDDIDDIFGHINELIPMHQELIRRLKQQRLPDGTTVNIGAILIDWIPQLKRYVDYCSNQIFAKDLLDRKKTDPSVEDFLLRCQNSPFSRKLDLWSFLDVPRSSLVKYPLLFKNIINYSHDPCEVELLERASANIEEIISDVNVETGKAKCRFIRSHLDYLEENQRNKFIDDSEAILCDGALRNSRGTKIQGFLFEKILVLTRQATRGNSLRYQIYRDPLPVSGPEGNLEVENLKDGAKMGSFKSTFSNSNTGKNLFKVTYGDVHHTLQANDEHDKRMWLNSLRLVTRESSASEDNSSPRRDQVDDENERQHCANDHHLKKAEADEANAPIATVEDTRFVDEDDHMTFGVSKRPCSRTPSRTSVDSALSQVDCDPRPPPPPITPVPGLDFNPDSSADRADSEQPTPARSRRCATPDQLPTEDVLVSLDDRSNTTADLNNTTADHNNTADHNTDDEKDDGVCDL